jgi:phosphatidylinositol alpha-1,6-mannosyltransferase
LDGRLVVLTVARLEERKGHDTVIEAINRILPDFDNLHYLIVGNGDPSRLWAMASERGMEHRLTILECLEQDELPFVYAASDVFVMVSRPGPQGEVEGFGIVYLEAAAAGLACIAGGMGGCRDAVVDGVTGLCVDPLDTTAVADALRTVLASPEVAQRMGTEGRLRVTSRFERAVLQQQATQVVEDVVRWKPMGLAVNSTLS